jgi:acyl-CoA synthetase (NDP forming)
MEKQKATELIKWLIDESIKKGVMLNIDTAIQIADAFNTIVSELKKTASNEATND